jgi:hypothetical protein
MARVNIFALKSGEPERVPLQISTGSSDTVRILTLSVPHCAHGTRALAGCTRMHDRACIYTTSGSKRCFVLFESFEPTPPCLCCLLRPFRCVCPSTGATRRVGLAVQVITSHSMGSCGSTRLARLILLLCAWAAARSSAVVIVLDAANGVDSADCSASSACRTLQRAADIANASPDTLVDVQLRSAAAAVAYSCSAQGAVFRRADQNISLSGTPSDAPRPLFDCGWQGRAVAFDQVRSATVSHIEFARGQSSVASLLLAFKLRQGLTVDDCVFRDSLSTCNSRWKARATCVDYNRRLDGDIIAGGAALYANSSRLTVRNSLFQNCSSLSSGGAILLAFREYPDNVQDDPISFIPAGSPVLLIQGSRFERCYCAMSGGAVGVFFMRLVRNAAGTVVWLFTSHSCPDAQADRDVVLADTVFDDNQGTIGSAFDVLTCVCQIAV